MTDIGGHLGRDGEYMARLQRVRRASMTMLDYMPNKEALAIMEAKRGRYYSSGRVYHVTLDDFQRYEELFMQPLDPKGPETMGAALYLSASMEAGLMPGLGWA